MLRKLNIEYFKGGAFVNLKYKSIFYYQLLVTTIFTIHNEINLKIDGMMQKGWNLNIKQDFLFIIILNINKLGLYVIL